MAFELEYLHQEALDIKDDEIVPHDILVERGISINSKEDVKFPKLLEPKREINDPNDILKMTEEQLKDLENNWHDVNELTDVPTSDDYLEEIPGKEENIEENSEENPEGNLYQENENNNPVNIGSQDEDPVENDQEFSVEDDMEQFEEKGESDEGVTLEEGEEGEEVGEYDNTEDINGDSTLTVSEELGPSYQSSIDSDLTRTQTLGFTVDFKDEAKKELFKYQLQRIKESFPSFGVSDDSDLPTQDIIFDEDGDDDFADKLFMLEVNSLLRKGNILKEQNQEIFEDEVIESGDQDEEGADEELLKEMGYTREDLIDDEDQSEDESNDMEDDMDSDEGKKIDNGLEMDNQLKEDDSWRDIPNLHFNNLVDVSRHVKVTKAGRVQSYSCTVFKGDGDGSAGMGYGKGDTPSAALKRASRDAERNAFTLDRYNELTLPSGLDMKYRSTKIRFFKSRPMDHMDYRGMKQNIILPTIGLHGVSFRTYGKRDWASVLLTLQKCLPHYTNPEEAARIMGKKFVTPLKEKSKKKTLSQLLQSKLENRNNDPYNLGMVSKFLFDVEEKPDIDAIKERREREELNELFDRYPIAPKSLYDNEYEEFKFNNNSTTKRVDKMHLRGRKHERNVRENSL